MSAEQERDARLFLEELYGPEPDGLIAITVAPEWSKPRCCKAPAGALYYVVGKRDVYFRLGLVAKQPSKRGVEADTISIPGVWVEIDLNGAPDGRRGTITDAAPTVEAAMELAHSVLEPTVMVRSGYGLHAYHLFTEPWRLAGEQDRAQAKRLVQGWQARLRQEAKERGIGRLDSTHDLARVFRVPGSFNGKADAPAPVRLLDNGGPRYTLEQLAAEVIEIEDEPVSDASGPEPSAGQVGEILDRHEDLAKIVARKGAKPGDGSGSAWDFMLGCRAAEHGYDDSTLAALIRHARRAHAEDKGERDDYVERTVAAVRKRVGHVGADAPRDEVLAELTKALRLGEAGRHVVSTLVTGHGNSATAVIELDDGYTIEFESFEHVAQPAKLADTLATTVGITTDFTKLQSRRAAALVRRSADRREEFRQHSIHVDAASRLLRIAAPLEFDLDDQASRWTTWLAIEDTDPDAAPEPEDDWKPQRRDDRQAAEAYGRRVVIPYDRGSGVRFVNAGWFQQFMRLRLGPSATPQKVRQTLLRAGWQTRGRDGRIKATRPRELGEEHTEISVTFYLVARGWETKLGAEEIGGGSR